MQNDLIAAAVEGLAISIKPKETIAFKTVASYGQLVNVVMAVPLAVTLGGPLTISEAPTPQPDFPSQAFQKLTRGTDQQIGRDAVEKALPPPPMMPFVNIWDGNERLRYRPNTSAYYSSQGLGSPLPLLMSSLVK